MARGRPRKPDALTATQKEKAYRDRHDLTTVKLPRDAVRRLDALARKRGLSRAQLVITLLELAEQPGPPPRAAPQPKTKPLPPLQGSLFDNDEAQRESGGQRGPLGKL